MRNTRGRVPPPLFCSHPRRDPMKPDLRDTFAAAGLALIGVGAGMIYLPAALILVGAVLCFVGLFGLRLG